MRRKLALSIGLSSQRSQNNDFVVLFAVSKVFSAVSVAKMEAEETVGVKARSVLWYLTFVGFAMNYMIR